MSFLDRSNIGNANLTGFSKDLDLIGNEYGAAVSVVYATYVVFEPFWTVLLKIITPKLLMTASCISWSALTIGTAFVKNFGQLVGVRVLLGATEAAIIPCILIYITMTYNRNEYAVRNTYIFTFSAISGAFGGLLAFGLTQINAAGLHGWQVSISLRTYFHILTGNQWMYIVEGIISFVLAPITLIWLPNNINEATWLRPHEKELMAKRLELNKLQGVYDADEQFRWSEIWRSLKDWKLWLQSVSHFGIDTTLYAITTFMVRTSQSPSISLVNCKNLRPVANLIHLFAAKDHCRSRIYLHGECSAAHSTGIRRCSCQLPHNGLFVGQVEDPITLSLARFDLLSHRIYNIGSAIELCGGKIRWRVLLRGRIICNVSSLLTLWSTSHLN